MVLNPAWREAKVEHLGMPLPPAWQDVAWQGAGAPHSVGVGGEYTDVSTQNKSTQVEHVRQKVATPLNGAVSEEAWGGVTVGVLFGQPSNLPPKPK